jgi:outer membrane protein insertion porin family
MLALAALASATSPAQPIDLHDAADRPISEIRIEGLQRVPQAMVRNQVRSAVGAPVDVITVQGDVRTLTRLGEFAAIDAIVELLDDGSVLLTFRVNEQPVVAEVQVVGNKLVSDQDLLALVPFTPGSPRDSFAIQNSVRAIEDLYRSKGHYLTEVQVDESRLEESGILVLRIIEGPRVRIKAIAFEGNQSYDDKQLRSQVSTRTWFPLLTVGELSEEKLINDVGKLVEFYKDRGHLDVRVDRRIELSPDNREAKVTFLVVEGAPFILRSVKTERRGGQPLRVLHPAQVLALMDLKPGDIFRGDKLRSSTQHIREAYGQLGHGSRTRDNQGSWLVDVDTWAIRIGEEKEVDLLIQIDEGRRYTVGPIDIQGNFLTKDKVIRREVRLEPGRPFDMTEVQASQERIERTRLFNEVRITVLEPDRSQDDGEPQADADGDGQPDDGDDSLTRDVLIEVKERNTGSLSFGVAAGTDTGLFGEISLNQDNFDIADVPESFSEWLRGRAFRGAGQRFNITLRPGAELSEYSVSLTEPHLLETDFLLGGRASFRDREFDDYDENRLTFSSRVGRRFGEVWDIGLDTRFERVELDNIDPDAPVDVFRDRGPDTLTGIGLSLTRTTVGTITRPGRGSRFELGIEQVGALGGDYDFTKLSGEYTVFLTLDEDFLGRKSILKLISKTAYIIGDEAPIYEKYYLGGRSFRGFEFRTVSPRGIRASDGELGNDSIGGAWLLFLGAQYEVPLWDKSITGVVFLDSGTVTNDIGIDDYRVALGLGLRLYIPQLGPTPIALDFAYPFIKEEGDQEQIFSFSAELPF